MYLKKNDLKNVLDALSPAEKKYFFKYIKSINNVGSPYYLELLDSFTKQKSVLPSPQDGASPQALTFAKRRLYSHLMQCLRNYHQKKSVQIILQTMLCEIEILYDLGLPDQSAVLLKKAYSRALAHEKYGLLLQILEWERKLNMILNNPKRSNDDIAKEEKQVLERFNQIIELESIFCKAKEMKKQYGYVKGKARQELERIVMKRIVLTKSYQPFSQRGKYYYHFIHSLYCWMTFNHKNAYRHSRKLLEPEMRDILLPGEYLDGILEHITSSVCLGYFQEALAGLDIATDFIKQHKFDQSNSFSVRMFYYDICYRLIIHNYMGTVGELKKAIKEAEEKVLLYDKQISLEMKQVIYGNLRNAYIGAGMFGKAEKIVDSLLRKELKFVREDVYNNLFLFRIFLLMNTRMYVLIPSVALSARRHFLQIKSGKNHLEAELKITALLMKEHDYNDLNIRKSVLTQSRNVLLQHISLLEGLNNFQESYSFYIIWIESLLRNKPFYSAAASWYQQYREGI